MNSILSLKDLNVPHTSWSLGNGKTIRFWEDTWAGTHKLKDAFPKVYEKALDKQCLVSSQGSGTSATWRWHILLRERRSVLQDLERMMSLIGEYGISDDKDKPGWVLSKSGIYTVNSLYKRMTIRGIGCPIYKHIWNIIVPLKVKIFMWILLKNRFQTKGNLVFKGWRGDPRCAMCLTTVETSEHLFAECAEIKSLWEDLIEGSNIILPSGGTTLWDSLIRVFSTSKYNDLPHLLIPTTTWCIWNERNNVIFKDRILDTKRLASSICHFLSFWLANSNKKKLEDTASALCRLKGSLSVKGVLA